MSFIRYKNVTKNDKANAIVTDKNGGKITVKWSGIRYSTEEEARKHSSWDYPSMMEVVSVQSWGKE
jgi:hypothetical protein